MKHKSLLRFVALFSIIALVSLFSAYRANKSAPFTGDRATEQKITNEEKKPQSEFMIWETISRHLLLFNQ